MDLDLPNGKAYAYTGGKPFDPALPTVVFLHGAEHDHSVWILQTRYLAHHGFASLAVDLPGHGRSPGNVRASIEALADWVGAFIEAACVGKAHVVGHSMGSLVALETALRHPQRVAKLVLAGPSVPMPVGEAFLAAAGDDAPEAFDMQTVWGHARNVALAASAIPGLSLAGVTRRLVGRARPGVQHADLAACHAYAPSLEAIRSMDIPALVIAGRRDVMTPLKAGQALAREIPGARLVALDAGHAMIMEAPREVLTAILAHLVA
jgi:pimeloyl-ACP methyl ester carboxylesterase